jgi:hypothetical protein
MKHWIFQVLIAIDQLVNALVPGGWADETLSARAYRMQQKGHRYWGWTATAIDKLFFWQPSHCRLAHEAELRRHQFPPAYRAPLTQAAPGIYYPPGSDPTDQ